MKTIRFKQFCYTHTTKGIYGAKGWQAVGVSDRDFFQPLLPKIQSAIAIPESANLQRETQGGHFQIFGLRKIVDYPVLIRISDAGLTADRRPGNIFVHILFPHEAEDVKQFFECDILSVFNNWTGWRTDWPEEPGDQMEIAAVDIPDHVGATQIEQARTISGDAVSLEKLAYAAELALHPKQPQYLLIQPAAESPAAAMIDLLRTLWSWLPSFKREQVQLWMGRNQLKLPSTNWNVLHHSTRNYIRPNMVDHIAHCFDFQHHNFSARIFSSETFLEIPVDLQSIRTRNANFDFVHDYFDYYGGNEVVFRLFLDLITKAGGTPEDIDEARLYDLEPDAMLAPFRTLSPHDSQEEFRHSFQTLLFLADKYARHRQKSPIPILEQAFNLNFPPDFGRRQSEQIVGQICKLLIRSKEWPWPMDSEVYQACLDLVIGKLEQGFGKTVARPMPAATPRLVEEVWVAIFKKASRSSAYLQVFQALLLYFAEKKPAGLPALFAVLKKEGAFNWLSAADPSEETERAWLRDYAGLWELSQVDLQLNTLNKLTVGAANKLQDRIVAATSRELLKDKERQLEFWAKAYRQNPKAEYSKAYFQMLERDGAATFSESSSLLAHFSRNGAWEEAAKEVRTRLQGFSRSSQPVAVPASPATAAYHNTPEVIRFFQKALALLTPPADAEVFRKALREQDNAYLTAELLLTALLGSLNGQSRAGIRSLEQLRERLESYGDIFQRANKRENAGWLKNQGVTDFRKGLLRDILSVCMEPETADQGLQYFQAFEPYLKLSTLFAEPEIEHLRRRLLGKLVLQTVDASNQDVESHLLRLEENRRIFQLQALYADLEEQIAKYADLLLRESFEWMSRHGALPPGLCKKLEGIVSGMADRNGWLARIRDNRFQLLLRLVRGVLEGRLTWSQDDMQRVEQLFSLTALLAEKSLKTLELEVSGSNTTIRQVEKLVTGLGGAESSLLDHSGIGYFAAKYVGQQDRPAPERDGSLYQRTPVLYFYKWWYSRKDAGAYANVDYLQVELFIRSAEAGSQVFLNELTDMIEGNLKNGMPLLRIIQKTDPMLLHMIHLKYLQHGDPGPVQYLMEKLLEELGRKPGEADGATKHELVGLINSRLKKLEFVRDPEWKLKIDGMILQFASSRFSGLRQIRDFLNLFYGHFDTLNDGIPEKRKLQGVAFRKFVESFASGPAYSGADNELDELVGFFRLAAFARELEPDTLAAYFHPEKSYPYQHMLDALNGNSKLRYDVCREVNRFFSNDKRHFQQQRSARKTPFGDVAGRMREQFGHFTFILAAARHAVPRNHSIDSCMRMLEVVASPMEDMVVDTTDHLFKVGHVEIMKSFTLLLFMTDQPGKRSVLDYFLHRMIVLGSRPEYQQEIYGALFSSVAARLCELIEQWKLTEREISQTIVQFLTLPGLHHYAQRLEEHKRRVSNKNK